MARERTLAKALAVRTLARAGYVRESSPRIKPDVDLIHSAQFLLRRPPAPYVVDFEQVSVFSLYQQLALTRPWARGAIAPRDPRRALPPSAAVVGRGARRAVERGRRCGAQGDDGPAGDPARGRRAAEPRRGSAARPLRRDRVLREGRGGGDPRRAARGERPARPRQLRPGRLRGAAERDRPRARPTRPGRAPVRAVARAAVPLAHGHVRVGRARGDGARAAGDRARPPRARRADRRRLRPALRAREHALRG